MFNCSRGGRNKRGLELGTKVESYWQKPSQAYPEDPRISSSSLSIARSPVDSPKPLSAWSLLHQEGDSDELERSGLDSDFKMDEIQYEPPEGPPPNVLNNDPENPFSDDNTPVELDTTNDPTQTIAPDFLTPSRAG